MLQCKGSRIKLRFKGWGPEYDEWVQAGSGRVRPLRGFTDEMLEAERKLFEKALEGYVYICFGTKTPRREARSSCLCGPRVSANEALVSSSSFAFPCCPPRRLLSALVPLLCACPRPHRGGGGGGAHACSSVMRARSHLVAHQAGAVHFPLFARVSPLFAFAAS